MKYFSLNLVPLWMIFKCYRKKTVWEYFKNAINLCCWFNANNLLINSTGISLTHISHSKYIMNRIYAITSNMTRFTSVNCSEIEDFPIQSCQWHDYFIRFNGFEFHAVILKRKIKLLTYYKHWEVMVWVCHSIFFCFVVGIKYEKKCSKETDSKKKRKTRKENQIDRILQNNRQTYFFLFKSQINMESRVVDVLCTHSIIVIWMKCESMQTRANFVTLKCLYVLVLRCTHQIRHSLLLTRNVFRLFFLF